MAMPVTSSMLEVRRTRREGKEVFKKKGRLQNYPKSLETRQKEIVQDSFDLGSNWVDKPSQFLASLVCDAPSHLVRDGKANLGFDHHKEREGFQDVW